ncbi:MAG: helix-turn-helix domain-containing protein [Acidimicrobiia bacterium]|nr:helix-turn-helix domain-containing protein [Acidimicrobiia bacterium]MDH3469734.1 helix-turn-helix domain-containing protein [Acidimicrobiia bacterium]
MSRYDAAPTYAAGLIRTARDMVNLTQRQLADLAGVTQQAISAYETGRKEPTLAKLMSLLRAAGLELRVRVVPLDRHDEGVEAFMQSLPKARRAEIETERSERAQQARLRRVKGK